jgi:hypothetical protein
LVEDVDPGKVMLVVSPFSTELTDENSRTLGYLEAMLLAGEIKIREPEDPKRIEPETGVRVVAVNLAESEGATSLRWSDDAAAVSFSYGAPTKRTVYIENVFSVGFKLEQVQAYALGGVAVADASAHRDVANIWPAVNELLEAGTVTLVRPNSDALVPRWEAPDGGRLDAAAGPTIIWRVEEEGTFTLRMLFSDGDLMFGREIEVEVKKDRGTPTPLVTFPADEATPTPTTSPTPTASPTPTLEPTPGPTPTPTPDVTAPGQVTGVTAGVTADPGEVVVTWDPSPEPDLAGYNIYRGTTSGGPYSVFVKFVSAGATAYFETGVSSGTYYYIVRAEDTSGNEGPASDEDPVTLP